MEFHLASWLFYLFSAVTLLSAVMVISSRNPVHSVLFLILAFFNAAGLFVLLGAEYIAMTLVIVYVGAVAVLFLFVVMMLDVNFAELREGFTRYLPVGGAVAGILFFELFTAVSLTLAGKGAMAPAVNPIPAVADVTNTNAIGNILYTQYIYAFQMAGLALLVAMIGAIVLTLRHKPEARRQNIARQVSRKRADSVALVNVKPGEGA